MPDPETTHARTFPFSAVLGHEAAKLALCLALVNPALRGVLLVGQRGSGKTTLARATARLVSASRIVEVPIGVTEDRLLGGPDLGRLLSEGRRVAETGLLREAHGQVLYVDNINLLSGTIANLLTGAVDEGGYHLRRDGLSEDVDSDFVLIGSLDPEEGALAPQLLDRFGLSANMATLGLASERAVVLDRRESFELAAPEQRTTWTALDSELRGRVAAARLLLPGVRVPTWLVEWSCRLCQAAGVLGHRADLDLIQAGRARAAMEERDTLVLDDLVAVAELVLLHRRNDLSAGTRSSGRGAQAPGQGSDRDAGRDCEHGSEQAPTQDSSSGAGPDAEPDGAPPHGGRGGAGGEPDSTDEDGSATGLHVDGSSPQRLGEASPERGADELATGAAAASELDPEDHLAGIAAALNYAPNPFAAPASRVGRRGPLGSPGTRGRHMGSTRRPVVKKDIAFDATLRAAAPWQRTRHNPSGMAFTVTSDDLRYKVRRAPQAARVLFLVDASGSMGALERLLAVKGAVMTMLTDAYRRRDEVGLVTFRGAEARLMLSPTRSVVTAVDALHDTTFGGRTPLAAGLKLALDQLAATRWRSDPGRPVLVVVSDGRANVAQAGGDPLGEALELCRTIRDAGVSSLVLDTEVGFVKLGQAVKLADALGAEYQALAEVGTTGIAERVRRVLG